MAAAEAYRFQRNAARRRGIPWEFTLASWWAWWSAEDRWRRRGCRAGDLVMARRGDRGPYSPGNVYCCTHSQNGRDMDRSKQRAAGHARWFEPRQVRLPL
jgi:hypothetical protein